jgi:hypothetical protein
MWTFLVSRVQGCFQSKKIIYVVRKISTYELPNLISVEHPATTIERKNVLHKNNMPNAGVHVAHVALQFEHVFRTSHLCGSRHIGRLGDNVAVCPGNQAFFG